MTPLIARRSRRRRLLRTLFWLTALTLLILVILAVPLGETVEALRRLTWRQLALLAGLNGVVLALFNARWWIILRGYGHKVPYAALFGYRLATFGVSYFTPGPHVGGEPLQVLLVEREQRIPRTTAIAAVTLDKTLELLVNFAFLLAGAILIVEQQFLGGVAAAGAISLVLFLVLLPAVYLLLIARGRSPLSDLITQVTRRLAAGAARPWPQRFARISTVTEASESEMAHLLQRAPLSLGLAFATSIAAWLLMVGEFWLMISYLGASLSLTQLIITLTAARTAILMFMPAGLGALEASQALAFGLIGLNPALGISASLLIRARDVVFGAIGLWWGSKKLSASYFVDKPHGGESS